MTGGGGGANIEGVSSSVRIVVAERYDPAAVNRLRAVGEVVELNRPDPSELSARVAEADALLVRTYTRVTEALIAAAPKLKVVGRGGVGLDNIDLTAARRRGIAVVYTPAASTDAVADLTMGLILSLVRRIPEVDRLVRAGRFSDGRSLPLGRELSELSLGIVGMGRIGRAVARRAHLGFGMAILYNDIVDVGALEFPAQALSKEELYARADVVSLHVPLTEQTRGMIGAAALERFRPEGLLINTARGLLVDSMALAERLHGGLLGGAGLDVVDPEPLPEEHPLLSAPRTVLTPHAGAQTRSSQVRMNDVVDDVIRVLRGETPRHAAQEG